MLYIEDKYYGTRIPYGMVDIICCLAVTDWQLLMLILFICFVYCKLCICAWFACGSEHMNTADISSYICGGSRGWIGLGLDETPRATHIKPV